MPPAGRSHRARVALLAVLLSAASATRPRRVAADSLFARLGPEDWLQRLASGDPAVRRGALHDLGRFAPPDPRIATEIAALVQHENDTSVLLAAVSALAVNRHPGSSRQLDAIAQGIRTTIPAEVQAAALRAVAQLRGPQAAAVLVATTAYATPEATAAATRGLAELPDGAFAQRLVESRRQAARLALMLRAIGARQDPRWGGFVIEQLRSPSGIVVAPALAAVGELRLAEATPEVIEIARDAQDLGLRAQALRVLGRLGDAVDPAVLRAGLQNARTRAAALEAMATLGDAQFVPDVRALLDASWSADRRAAAETLVDIQGERAAPVLAARLAHEDDEGVRTDLAHALARAGGAMAEQTLLVRAAHDASARWALVEWIARGRALAGEPSGLGANVRAGDASALVLAGLLHRFERERETALGATDANVRVGAALSLVATGDPDVDLALARRLRIEDDEGVRAALALALGASGTDIAQDALLAMIEREAAGALPAVLVAVESAGRLGLRDAAPAIRAFLHASDPLARHVAAWALGAMGDSAARAPLTAVAMYDADADTRSAALRALAVLAGPAAIPTIEEVSRIAWTDGLIDAVERARRIALGVEPPVPFVGREVARVHGVAPRSVWVSVDPDGRLSFTVAAGDGEIVRGGVSSERTLWRRIDAP